MGLVNWILLEKRPLWNTGSSYGRGVKREVFRAALPQPSSWSVPPPPYAQIAIEFGPNIFKAKIYICNRYCWNCLKIICRQNLSKLCFCYVYLLFFQIFKLCFWNGRCQNDQNLAFSFCQNYNFCSFFEQNVQNYNEGHSYLLKYDVLYISHIKKGKVDVIYIKCQPFASIKPVCKPLHAWLRCNINIKL